MLYLYRSLCVLLLLSASHCFAIDTFEFSTQDKKAQAIELAKTLRCPQCQNQNLVDSNSPIAKDLRNIVYQQIESGQSQEQVVAFMTQRYGEFILYEPQWSGKTVVLWLAPLLLMGLACPMLYLFLRSSFQKNRTIEHVSQEHLQKVEQLLLKKGDQ